MLKHILTDTFMQPPSFEIFENNSGSIEVRLDSENETVWLPQSRLVQLFDSSKANISEHIKNIFAAKELSPSSTVRKFRTVQKEGKREVAREIDHYNLDLIISLGYRVNSKIGIQFRKWANSILKAYLTKGYSINAKKLALQDSKLQELKKATALIIQAQQRNLSGDEASGVLNVLSEYLNSFVLLNQYDTGELDTNNLNEQTTIAMELDDSLNAIEKLKSILIDKNEATELFGKQKDSSFDGILNNMIQSFDGEYLYPSIEEQAAHLLYFIIKNHPFIDGNKRIGSFMFVWFLEKNNHLLKSNSERKINDNALVALALLVAQSMPDQKEVMIKLIINLIKDTGDQS